MLCQDRRQRPVAEDLIDLVWTGPEAAGIVNRDTSVVVREMFQSAGNRCWSPAMPSTRATPSSRHWPSAWTRIPQLSVQMFLDIQRPSHDHSSPSELVRRFAERFADQRMARPAVPRTLLRSQVPGDGPCEARQPSRKMHRRGQGAGLRFLGQFHRSRPDEEHRGWRVDSILSLCQKAIGALRDSSFDLRGQASSNVQLAGNPVSGREHCSEIRHLTD